MPQSGLVYVRFAGLEPRAPGGLPGYTRREEFNGALARVIENAWSILLQEMRGEAVVRGLQREDRMLYPPFAVREALVNAVCHRDYRLTGRKVEIRQFDDRLEIFSPGGLPGYITLGQHRRGAFLAQPSAGQRAVRMGLHRGAGAGSGPHDRGDAARGASPARLQADQLLFHRGAAASGRAGAAGSTRVGVAG